MNTTTTTTKRLPNETDREFLIRRLREVHGIEAPVNASLKDLFHLSPTHECFDPKCRH